MNRWLVCHPGSFYSTGDVFNGIVPELEKLGIEVIEYDLGSRLDMSGRFLNMVWRHKVKAQKLDREAAAKAKYSPADVIYGASKDILERALRWEVDGVLIFSGMFLHPDLLIVLKRAHIRTALLGSESPYDDAKMAKVLPLVDVAWTNERSSVATLRKANPNVNYMPHAFNPEIHKPIAEDDPDDIPAHDVVFVGSLFSERVDLLSQVDWSGINLGLYGEWSGLPGRHKLRRHLAGDVVDNRYTAALYRKAKIGLNLYRESMGWGKDAPRLPAGSAESMNPRTLELAACGTFQISQWRSEISETFGIWVPTFEDVTEMERLIRYYLSFEDQRKLHARKAMEAVQPHTFAARARTIVDDLTRAEWPVKQMVAV